MSNNYPNYNPSSPSSVPSATPVLNVGSTTPPDLVDPSLNTALKNSMVQVGSDFYFVDETGTAVKLTDPVEVLTTVQPTPTATGNTTNLNSIFTDANGDTWFVDTLGNAVKTGSASLVHTKETVTATAGMTSVTLTDTPVGSVIVTRNGVDISDSWTWVDNVGTYDPALNLNCTIDADDILRFHFETAA